MGMRLIALSGCLLVAVLIMAGCGSGDSSTASISKAEFIKQAEAACKKGEEGIQKDFLTFVNKHKNVKKPTEADYAELVDVVMVPNITAEIDEIQALGAPSGDEDQIDAMLKAREESVKIAEDEPELIVKESKKIFGKASKAAKEYGLEVCANR